MGVLDVSPDARLHNSRSRWALRHWFCVVVGDRGVRLTGFVNHRPRQAMAKRNSRRTADRI